MNETIIPATDAIPAHWLWFQVLLIFTFFIHMLLMNFILGGSLLTVWDLIRGKLEKNASGSIPTLIALTINFGVPPLLFVQVLYGHLFYSSSILLAVPWILLIPVLILAYYGAYLFCKRIDRTPGWAKGGLVVSSLFLLFVAFMFVNNSTLAIRPDRWGLYFEDPSGLNLNLGEPTLWPRYLHFILSALGIGALGRAIFYRFSKMDPEMRDSQISRNLKIFGWITLVQMGIGTWFWLSMPSGVWKVFMGQDLFATILMALSWIGALLILHSAFTGRLVPAMVLGGLQVLFMVVIRDLARTAYLDGIFHPAELEIAGQPGPLFLFLLIFAAGLILIYYMLRLMSKPKSRRT